MDIFVYLLYENLLKTWKLFIVHYGSFHRSAREILTLAVANIYEEFFLLNEFETSDRRFRRF